MAEELDVVGMGVAIGSVTGLYMLFAGLSASFFGTGAEIVQLMSGMYAGYSATVVGSFIGALWGFFDGFVLGAVLAWVYNFVLEKR